MFNITLGSELCTPIVFSSELCDSAFLSSDPGLQCQTVERIYVHCSEGLFAHSVWAWVLPDLA